MTTFPVLFHLKTTVIFLFSCVFRGWEMFFGKFCVRAKWMIPNVEIKLAVVNLHWWCFPCAFRQLFYNALDSLRKLGSCSQLLIEFGIALVNFLGVCKEFQNYDTVFICSIQVQTILKYHTNWAVIISHSSFC